MVAENNMHWMEVSSQLGQGYFGEIRWVEIKPKWEFTRGKNKKYKQLSSQSYLKISDAIFHRSHC